jgi:hypothetical protein
MCLNLIGKKEQALLLRPTRICSKLVYPVHLHILKLMVKFMLRVLQLQPAMLTTVVVDMQAAYTDAAGRSEP